jgi:hypothetical protein
LCCWSVGEKLSTPSPELPISSSRRASFNKFQSRRVCERERSRKRVTNVSKFIPSIINVTLTFRIVLHGEPLLVTEGGVGALNGEREFGGNQRRANQRNSPTSFFCWWARVDVPGDVLILMVGVASVASRNSNGGTLCWGFSPWKGIYSQL